MKKLLFLTISCIVFAQQAAHAMSPLHIASINGDIDQVTALLNSGADFNQPDNLVSDRTPLHWAAYKGHKAVVKLFLNHGANVDQSNEYGRTPLHFAVRKGYEAHEAVVRLLLEHGAGVNKLNKEGWTPLHVAACNGHKNIVRLLLEWGADVNLLNNDGKTPLQEAAQYGHKDVVLLLKAWPIMQLQACVAARLAFCAVHYHHLGAESSARDLPQYLLKEILQYVQPSDFSAIATVPQHAWQWHRIYDDYCIIS